jgi:hypothetical protein
VLAVHPCYTLMLGHSALRPTVGGHTPLLACQHGIALEHPQVGLSALYKVMHASFLATTVVLSSI